MPNIDLLRKTLAHIEANPDQWDQTVWRNDVSTCGTAYCFAGWAAVLNGAKFYQYAGEVSVDLVVAPGSSEPLLVEGYAVEILGLEYGDISDEPIPLFRSGNTLDDLRRMVGELCESAEAVASDG